MRHVLLWGALALIVPAVAATASEPAPTHRDAAGAAVTCEALKPTKSLRRKLRRIHIRTLRRGTDEEIRVRGPVGRVYVGRCGTTRWALASFSHRIGGTFFGTQDQPERFRRRRGRPWKDLGDTGGDPCGIVPKRLLVAWGLECRRG
jgi:hypothetical protein